MKLHVESTILLFGIIQGLVLILIAIRSKRGVRLSNNLFAAIILILCMTTIDTILFEFLDWGQLSDVRRTFLNSLPLEPITCLGPLIFFYLQSLFDHSFRITKSDRYLFLPVILEVVPFAISIVFVSSQQTFFSGKDESYVYLLNRYMTYVALPEFLLLVFYLVKSMKYLAAMRNGADSKTLRWAKDLLIGFGIVALVWFPFLIASMTPLQVTLLQDLHYYPIYYPVVGLIFFLGIRLMTNNMAFRPNPYAQTELAEKVALLNMLIQDKRLYSNSELNLQHLSSETGIPDKSISFILNHHLNKGFREYINEFRVNEAIERMQKGELNKLTLEALGFKVGFSSRSTFYRSFKQVTGQEPSAYVHHYN